jgi:hypothetical protein
MPELDWDVICFLVLLLVSGVLIVLGFSLPTKDE